MRRRACGAGNRRQLAPADHTLKANPAPRRCGSRLWVAIRASLSANALFAGLDGGGEHWTVIASLIETCKLIGVEPHAYLAEIITRIVNDHPNCQIDELLPWAYLTTQERSPVA